MVEHTTGDVTVTIPAEVAARVAVAYRAHVAAIDLPATAAGVRAEAAAKRELAAAYGDLARHGGGFLPLIHALIAARDEFARLAGQAAADAERIESGPARVRGEDR